MSDCIIFKGYIDKLGYGARRLRGKLMKAHRAAWQEAHGPIPDGMEVCHHCDVRACINVKHLFLGTHKDNMRDMVAKNRGRSGQSKLSPEAVCAIRQAKRDGRWAYDLAQSLNVSVATIWSAARGESYRWVA